MKKIFILVSIVACNNPKEEIVEKQKKLKHDMLLEEVRIGIFTSDANKMLRNKDSLLSITYQTKYQQLSDSVDYHERLKANYQGVSDSLEMELKKY